MGIPSVSPKNVAGLADKVVGLTKEVLGTALGRDGITRSGQLQQEAGSEKIKALQAELNAQSKEGKAAGAEQAQKSAKASKESAKA